MWTPLWVRFLAAAAGAIAGSLLALGAGALVGLPGYLLGILVFTTATLVIAAKPWRLAETLAAAAGTLFGPALAFMVLVLGDIVRGNVSPGALLVALFVTVVYFTGLPTLLGLLICTALLSRGPTRPTADSSPR